MKVIAIVGPTASGKSDLAIELARKFSGEIISVDSRQLYRGLDLGTGKVTKTEQKMVRHHMLDLVNPGKTYTVAQFKKRAERVISDILRRGKIPILVGGSHLYMRALLYNYEIPSIAINKIYRRTLEKKTTPALLAMLKKIDAPYYDRVDRMNRRRIIRALEVYHESGRTFSSLTGKMKPLYNACILGIDIPRDILYSRIDARVDSRVRKGMIREVDRLIARGISKRWLKSIGLEYHFISEFLTGTDRSAEKRKEMLSRIKFATHDFARRQLVWYRKEKNINWIRNKQDATRVVASFLKD